MRVRQEAQFALVERRAVNELGLSFRRAKGCAAARDLGARSADAHSRAERGHIYYLQNIVNQHADTDREAWLRPSRFSVTTESPRHSRSCRSI